VRGLSHAGRLAGRFEFTRSSLAKAFHFADDAAFNGQKRELVAADLAYSMKRLLDPKTRSPDRAAPDGKIAGTEKVSPKAA
jgi:hypothetical protein